MYYEIVVSLNGKFLFATDKRSCQWYWELEKFYNLFKEKFPESEGYKITITHWATIGFQIGDIQKHIEEEKNK